MRASSLVRLVVVSQVVLSGTLPQWGAAADPSAQTDTAQHNTIQGKTPKLKIGTAENLFDLGAEAKMLAWEKWHHRVGNALSKRINRATFRMMGTALVRITVQRDHKVMVDLISASNPQLGDACVSAASTLDGDPMLEFPAESKRDAIAFRFQFKRGLLTIPGKHFIKDDYEKVGE